MNLKTFALSAALACFLLAPAMPVQAQTIASKVENQGDSRYIKVTGLMARERNGLLQLQIELANGDNEPQKAYYRIKWLDDGGFQVWDDEPWKPLLIQGSAKQNIQAVAPTRNAKDFKIQFNAEKNWSNDPTKTTN